MNMKDKVGIILVNYNGEEYIENCIDSLLAQTYKNVDILFWDNASEDSSVKLVKEHYPDVYLVESKYNYGFAKANNMAVKKLLKMGAEYVLLLNVDTVADPFLIEYLLEKADDHRITTAQISTDKSKTKIWYAGGELQLDKGSAKHIQLKAPSNVRVTFISGCCMMIHRKLIERYGLFDEKYYLYYEDVDLCMRWYLNHVEMCYVPKAKLWHKVGASSGGIRNPVKEYYITRNRLYFIHKYCQVMRKNTIKIGYSVMKDGAECIRTGNSAMVKAWFLGIVDYLLQKTGKLAHKL